MKSLIFVVDSEPAVCEAARRCLEAAGYSVRTFSGAKTDSEEEQQRPSLIVIGMGLQNGIGVEILSEFCGTTSSDRIPHIALLDNGSAEQRRMALNTGADDIVVKPFTPRALVMRVQALLRRPVLSIRTEQTQEAELIIDNLAMRLLVRGVEVTTTALEFRLLEYLAQHRGQVFTRDFLLDAVWGDMRFINPRSVDACIRRIREKIEPDRAKPRMLKSIRGVGYCLDAVAAWRSAPMAACDCSTCRTRTIDQHSPMPGTKQGRDSA